MNTVCGLTRVVQLCYDGEWRSGGGQEVGDSQLGCELRYNCVLLSGKFEDRLKQITQIQNKNYNYL